MAAVLTLLCLTLATAIACAAFVYGKQIGYTKRDNELKESEIKALQETMAQMDLEYRQLEVQLTQERRDNQRVSQGGWDPSQLSSRG